MSFTKFLYFSILIISSNFSLFSQDRDVKYNDTLTKKLFSIKKEYSKKIFQSTFYTIQIYYGTLEIADSVVKDFRENFDTIKSELIFETPNYKVRIGEFRDPNIAAQKLEEIRRIYPESFIIKLTRL